MNINENKYIERFADPERKRTLDGFYADFHKDYLRRLYICKQLLIEHIRLNALINAHNWAIMQMRSLEYIQANRR